MAPASHVHKTHTMRSTQAISYKKCKTWTRHERNRIPEQLWPCLTPDFSRDSTRSGGFERKFHEHLRFFLQVDSNQKQETWVTPSNKATEPVPVHCVQYHAMLVFASTYRFLCVYSKTNAKTTCVQAYETQVYADCLAHVRRSFLVTWKSWSHARNLAVQSRPFTNMNIFYVNRPRCVGIWIVQFGST